MEQKTNVMRLLGKAKIHYNSYCYTDNETTVGTEVAAILNQPPDKVFKTLVAVGKTNQHYVFVIPVHKELAHIIGMSETKMKLLFKKIFGTSIYNYYSSARMIEAASILKNDKNISVSEVGYSLGFSNLSHFSKMFKKHIGLKPKEYALKNA